MGIANDLAMQFLEPRIVPGWKVLDVGCRDSNWPIRLASMGCDVTAVDIDMEAIKRLTQKVYDADLDVKVWPCDARRLAEEFKGEVGTYDCVTGVWCIQHIIEGVGEDIKAYCACADMLRRGGSLMLVQSHALESTRFDHERLDPQRINSTLDVFRRIVGPTKLRVKGIESFWYDYPENIGHWDSLERSNAICLHLVKE